MPGAFTLSHDAMTGEMVCTGSGPVPAAALSALVSALVRASLPADDAPAPGSADRAQAFRISAVGLAELALAISHDIAAAIGEECGFVTDARVDGVLRTDDGYTAWGYLELATRPIAMQRPIDVRAVDIIDHGRVTTLRATLIAATLER